jgi:SPX domain protein involved in polyphosphate accumulation
MPVSQDSKSMNMRKEELITALYKALATQYMHDFVSQFGKELIQQVPEYVQQLYPSTKFTDDDRKKAVEGITIELEKLYTNQIEVIEGLMQDLENLIEN